MASKGTVLIIDDDSVFRHTFMDRIAADGYVVIEAFDGEDGLQKMRLNQVDAVICDMLMPRKSGSQVLAEMSADPKLQKIPVIVLSALGEQSDVKKAIDAGASDYLVKGMFGPNDVLAKLTNVLAQKHPEFITKYVVSVNPAKYDGVKLATELGFLDLYTCKKCGQEKKLELVPKAGSPDSFDARFVCDCPPETAKPAV